MNFKRFTTLSSSVGPSLYLYYCAEGEKEIVDTGFPSVSPSKISVSPTYVLYFVRFTDFQLLEFAIQ